MDASKESTEKALIEERLSKSALKIAQDNARMKLKMRASGTAKRVFIWLSHKWLDLFVFLLTIIATMSILGVLAKIIWTIWTIIFSVNL